MTFQNIVSCKALYNIPLMTNEINEKESKSYNDSNYETNENFINEMTNEAILRND